VKTERKSVSSAHKLDGLGKIKEHAPRSEHVHLHQDIGHIRKNPPKKSCLRPTLDLLAPKCTYFNLQAQNVNFAELNFLRPCSNYF
jgi:hypothetical protein